jgi:hypothetical protein
VYSGFVHFSLALRLLDIGLAHDAMSFWQEQTDLLQSYMAPKFQSDPRYMHFSCIFFFIAAITVVGMHFSRGRGGKNHASRQGKTRN